MAKRTVKTQPLPKSISAVRSTSDTERQTVNSTSGKTNWMFFGSLQDMSQGHPVSLRLQRNHSYATCSLTTCARVRAESYPTLCDLRDCSPPVSSVHGILQAGILEWVAMPFFRGSSWPRDGTWVSCIAGRFFTTEPPGKPKLEQRLWNWVEKIHQIFHRQCH